MNLMGPAMAVLVLPTLQYIEMPHQPIETFKGHNAASPPELSGRSEFVRCDADDFHAFNDSCTLSSYRPSLDIWATLAKSSIDQGGEWSATSYSQSQEGSVGFLLNATKPDADPSTLWVPNRQVLTSLPERVQELEDGDEDSKVWKNSLQLLYNRRGPAFALEATCSIVHVRTAEVSKDKDVICSYDGDSDLPTTASNDYCFPRGTGWAMGNRQSQFFVQRESSTNFSDLGRSASTVKNYFFPLGLNMSQELDLYPCRDDPSLKSCDWEKIFADSQNRSLVNVGITEYNLSG